jgi:hypothetical protein
MTFLYRFCYIARYPSNFAQTEFSEVRRMVALGSHRAKPGLAIWAHQVRQISGQALEACRRG